MSYLCRQPVACSAHTTRKVWKLVRVSRRVALPQAGYLSLAIPTSDAGIPCIFMNCLRRWMVGVGPTYWPSRVPPGCPTHHVGTSTSLRREYSTLRRRLGKPLYRVPSPSCRNLSTTKKQEKDLFASLASPRSCNQ